MGRPGMDGPEMDGPGLNGPDVDRHDMDGPDMDGHDMDVPDMDVPDIDMPKAVSAAVAGAFDPDSASSISATQPAHRYGKLIDDLRGEIETGHHAVGARLPTERELSITHGVSRATVRKALHHLERLGMIRRVQGAGTTVIARAPRLSREASYSLDHLFGYPEDSTLDFLDVGPPGPVEVDGLRALGALDEPWLRAQVLRRRICDGALLFFTRAFIPARLIDVLSHPDCARVPFYKIMRESFGVKMQEARLVIQPTLLPADVQRHLRGSVSPDPVAGLRLERTYFDVTGKLQQRSLSWHAEEAGGIVANFPLN